MGVRVEKKTDKDYLRLLITSSTPVRCKFCEEYRRLGMCKNPYFCAYSKHTERVECVG